MRAESKQTDNIKRISRKIFVLALGLLILSTANQLSFASDVKIWDKDISGWTANLANGDPIDIGTDNHAYDPQLAVDPFDLVYITYRQSDGEKFQIYLNRYDGKHIGTWDSDTSSWTTNLSDGDPIDTGTANNADNPQIAIDSQGIVYITYQQWHGPKSHIYLSRFDGRDVSIWDNDTLSWSTNLSDGDPIDTGTDNSAYDPQIAIDANGFVYITYRQYAGINSHIYLSRYDGVNVSIWDKDSSNWTTSFDEGDPIDTGNANSAFDPQLAINGNGIVYLVYELFDGKRYSIYLSRYDGTKVEIWDNDISDWSATFADGDSINTGSEKCEYPQLAVDPDGVLYITFRQYNSDRSNIYISRYDGFNISTWDNNLSNWTSTIADGDPIDTGTADHACESQLAIDDFGIVYITYRQYDGGQSNIYLGRYDGTEFSIWDKDTSSWITTLSDGDPIDTGSANHAHHPHLKIDKNGVVYVTYYKYDGQRYHIYLSRYDGSEISIWDNDTASWTTSLSDGDPIDTGTPNNARDPRLAIDSQGAVHVTFYHSDGARDHIYLSRYQSTETSSSVTLSGGGGGCFISSSSSSSSSGK